MSKRQLQAVSSYQKDTKKYKKYKIDKKHARDSDLEEKDFYLKSDGKYFKILWAFLSKP